MFLLNILKDQFTSLLNNIGPSKRQSRLQMKIEGSVV